jgi:hypothetical protein
MSRTGKTRLVDALDDVGRDGTGADSALTATAELTAELRLACAGAEPIVQPPLLPRERALAKLRAGVPLIHAEPLVVRGGRARELVLRVSHLLERQAPCPGAAQASAAVERGQLDLEQALVETMASHLDHLSVLAGAAGTTHEALLTIFDPIARAALAQLRSRLTSLLPAPGAWGRRYCPLCGSRGQAQAVAETSVDALSCARCGAVWSVEPGGSGQTASEPTEFRIELGEPHVDEALDDLLEAD